MPYTEEEIRSLIDAGDAERREDGATVWARDNSQGKQPGAWVTRPPGAAAIITSETADDLGRVRQEKKKQRIENGFAKGMSRSLGAPHTPDEALEELVALMTERGIDPDSKDGIRFLELVLKLMDLLGKKEIVVDRRTQIVEIDAEELHIMRGWMRLDDGSSGD